jgi:hypothetical protein
MAASELQGLLCLGVFRTRLHDAHVERLELCVRWDFECALDALIRFEIERERWLKIGLLFRQVNRDAFVVRADELCR